MNTPVHPQASHTDGASPPRHYSVVFHRDHPGREVARFVDPENHRNDAGAFIAAATHDMAADLGAIERRYNEALELVSANRRIEWENRVIPIVRAMNVSWADIPGLLAELRQFRKSHGSRPCSAGGE